MIGRYQWFVIMSQMCATSIRSPVHIQLQLLAFSCFYFVFSLPSVSSLPTLQVILG